MYVYMYVCMYVRMYVRSRRSLSHDSMELAN